jgi:hypothetical protein
MYKDLPLEEIKQVLAERYDEVALLELFDLSPADLVERCFDLIEDDPDKYLEKINELEIEGFDENE